MASHTGSFDETYSKIITPFFDTIPDDRKGNKSYSISDVLKAGFAVFSLKSPSLLSFQKTSTAEDSNIKNIYKIKEVPSDNGLRKVLDGAPPSLIRMGFHKLYEYAREINVLEGFRYWDGHLLVSVDGVEFFTSKEVSCDKCMQRIHRDGSTSFYHSMLSAVIVNPEQKEVLPLDNEPIEKQDGNEKNDCERNAAKRLMENLKRLYSNELMVFTFDALYACAPLVEQLGANDKWKFVMGIKEDGSRHLFRQYEEKKREGMVNRYKAKAADGTHEFGYVNDLALNASSPGIRVNMLYYLWINKSGEEKKFTWITNIELNKSNVMKVMKMGRARWKIENETFNTLKNQGYNFSHNYGHGEKNLCTIFAYLMMLAFSVDQMQQHRCIYFNKLLAGLKTKAKLWDAVRAVFKIIPRKNMTEVFFSIAEMYQIRII